MLLIIVGAVGLQVLSGVNQRTEELIKLQRKIEAYRQVQHDTTSQLYSVSTALLLADEQTMASTLRQLNQFGYDVDRLEFVATINGVDYFNDSKATNVDATLKALESFPLGIHILLGGKDKDSDYTVLKPLLRERAKRVARAVLQCPDQIGVGIDEKAALVVHGHRMGVMGLVGRSVWYHFADPAAGKVFRYRLGVGEAAELGMPVRGADPRVLEACLRAIRPADVFAAAELAKSDTA